MNGVELGKKYRDRITGFEGTCVGKAQYLYGCNQAYLKTGRNGEVKSEWFDEQGLVDVESGQQVTSLAIAGGPQATPPERSASM